MKRSTTSNFFDLQVLLPVFINRFHVAVRSQMTSKCGKNKEVAHEPQASVSPMFLPHFDVPRLL